MSLTQNSRRIHVNTYSLPTTWGEQLSSVLGRAVKRRNRHFRNYLPSFVLMNSITFLPFRSEAFEGVAFAKTSSNVRFES